MFAAVCCRLLAAFRAAASSAKRGLLVLLEGWGLSADLADDRWKRADTNAYNTRDLGLLLQPGLVLLGLQQKVFVALEGILHLLLPLDIKDLLGLDSCYQFRAALHRFVHFIELLLGFHCRGPLHGLLDLVELLRAADHRGELLGLLRVGAVCVEVVRARTEVRFLLDQVSKTLSLRCAWSSLTFSFFDLFCISRGSKDASAPASHSSASLNHIQGVSRLSQCNLMKHASAYSSTHCPSPSES